MGKALVAWTREHIDTCDVIHAHEWGGLLVDLATLDSYRQLKPGKAYPLKNHSCASLTTLSGGQHRRRAHVGALRKVRIHAYHDVLPKICCLSWPIPLLILQASWLSADRS